MREPHLADAPARVAVLGAGSWGTTFAKILGDAAEASSAPTRITLWARRQEVAEEIRTHGTNSTYLGELRLPGNVTASTDLSAVVAEADVVVLAVPAQSLREHLHAVRDVVGAQTVFVSLIKGLERGTDMRMSEIIAEELSVPPARIAVVSGPNLAMEIARGEPTASVVASADATTAERITALCSTGYFRPYTNDDVVGVELAGIVKNVIALAVGFCDGQDLGDNSKASVITRGLAETRRLTAALGGEVETLAGLAGLGDVVATCASPLSRNRSAGRLLGTGLSAEETSREMTQTAEGMKSASAVVELAQRHGVEMPIAEAVVAVLDGALPVERLATLLLARDLKSEGK
ncbi:MAG: NAD(P)H-dependent glycerol-3-phosphate dehydrogenase [Nesterenkonia sp.]|nr:NAD(P)H-dependent glycerol-3-phosphate dehydrogenase [Nesterenkonia sp.]